MAILRIIDRFLYARGFVQDDIRSLMRSQLLLSLALALGLLGVTLGSPWAQAFLAGALIITLNFWALAHVVQQLVYVRKGAIFTLLVIFYGKLLISGVLLYLVLGVWHLPVWGLVAGLSTVVVSIIAWGLSRFGKNKPDV